MRPYDAVIFDMDGTLIEPLLDFKEVRRILGVGDSEGIIEAIDARPEPQRTEAHRRLLEFEISAAREARLLDGAAEVVGAVRRAGLKTALLTRNAGEAMRIVLSTFADLRFDLAWSREDGPVKPDPAGMLRACQAMGVRPGRTACVGDFHYDISAANGAGAVSIFLARGRKPHWASEADFVIEHLRELTGLLGL